MRLHLADAVARRESSADIVQSVCGDVLDDIAGFRSGSEVAFKAWLFRAVSNKLANKSAYHRAARRDVRRERATPINTVVEESALLAGYRAVSSPTRDAAVTEEIEHFERAFDAMPDDYRAVILHVSIAGLAYRDAATIMGRTEDAVRQLLHRARARLATLLD